MLQRKNVTQIPTMMNSIHCHQREQELQKIKLDRIDQNTRAVKNIFVIILWVIISVVAVHIAETIKFNEVIRNATFDCIAEERDYYGY